MADQGTSSPTGSDKFTCSICLEFFKKPKLLPCFHTFCLTCLDTYVKEKTKHGAFECPLCRTSITLPQSGAGGFQSNFYIREGQEESAAPVNCDMCEEQVTASNFCVDCEQKLCETCTKHHMKMKMSREHKLLALHDANSGLKRKIHHRIFCADHEIEEIKFVCKQCDKVLCLVCKLTNHENHTTKDVSSAAKDMRSKISEALENNDLNNYLAQVKKDLDKSVKGKGMLTTLLDGDIRSVRGQASKLHAAVDKIAQIREKELRELYTKDIAVNKELTLELESKYQSCSSVKFMAEQIMQQDGDVDILQKGTDLTKNLNNLWSGETKVNELNYKERFSVGLLDETALQAMFGVVSSFGTDAGILKAVDLNTATMSQVSSFIIPHKSAVSGIVPVGDGKAWVSTWGGTTVHFVDLNGRQIEAVDAGVPCSHITARKGVEFVLTSNANRCIKEVGLTTNGRKINDIKIDRSEPIYGSTYRKSPNKQSELMYATETGTYCLGSMGTSSSLRSIRTTRVACDDISGNICMASWHDDMAVVVQDQDGSVIGQYTDRNFQPNDVLFYHQNCIVIANRNGDVRTIKPDGSGMKVILADKSKKYWSLAFDDSGRMWVGLAGGKVEVYKIGKQ